LKHFGVGEPGGVIDRDVDVLPADRVATYALKVGAAVAVVPAAGDAMPGTGSDPAELLDVDVDQLARTGALVAATLRLEPQATEPAGLTGGRRR
jgi:hypothetical protein